MCKLCVVVWVRVDCARLFLGVGFDVVCGLRLLWLSAFLGVSEFRGLRGL